MSNISPNQGLAEELYAVYDSIWTREHPIQQSDARTITQAIQALRGQSEMIPVARTRYHQNCHTCSCPEDIDIPALHE